MTQKILEQYPEPLIGLQELTEYTAGDKTVFWCRLCEASCPSLPAVICHVTASQHRINYMRLHYLSYLKVIQSSPVEKETGLLHEYARIIEETEGRQRIELRNELNLSEFMEYSGLHQSESSRVAAVSLDQPNSGASTSSAITSANAASDGTDQFQNASIMEILHKLAVRSGYKCVGEMMKSCTQNMVSNEEEATKALETANLLTKAVLNYRLSNSPK